MVTLRVVVDNILDQSQRGIARYSLELTRALVNHAPRDCDVEGVIAASSDEEYAEIERLIPGLSGLHKSRLPHRELVRAWQHGFSTTALKGMVHSPSVLAPLIKHDRAETPGEQTVITIHDASPWLYPEASGARGKYIRHMAGRARKHADAIIVPTHAVARELADHIDFGDRVRVIGGAVSSHLALPADVEEAVDRLDLPAEGYLLAIASPDPRKGLDDLLAAMVLPTFPRIPLLLVGEPTWGERTVEQAIVDSCVDPRRVRHLGNLADSDLAVVLDSATAFVLPSSYEGFGLTAIEALHFGTPLIHSDVPALVEVVADAGVIVERDPSDSAAYRERLAQAVAETVSDETALDRLSIRGLDRAQAFSWRDSAERVWQLHADL